jgi:urease accessory protein
VDAALLLLTDSRLPAGGHAHSGGVEEAVRSGAITGPEDLARFLRGRLATAGLVTAALSAAACELARTDRATPPAPHPSPTADATTARPGSSPGFAADATTARPGSSPGFAADAMRSRWLRLDAEADARTASPAQREASRTQGRLLIRTARRIWPSPGLDSLAGAVPEGAHHPLALGATAAAAGGEARDAALAAAYASVTGPATAAVRLLGLDPVTVHRLLADLAPAINDAVHAACASLMDSVVTGPDSDPLVDAPASGPAFGADPGAGLPAHAAPALDLLAEGHRRNPTKLFVS